MKSQIFFLISIVVLGGRVDAHTETVKNAVADPGETKVGDANFHLLVDIMSVMEKGVKGLIKEIDEQKHPQKGNSLLFFISVICLICIGHTNFVTRMQFYDKDFKNTE